MAGQAVRQSGAGAGMAADWAERLFKLSAWRTNIGTELLAGLTTFMVMAYIIFVNPTILTTTQANPAALRPGITTATCLVAGLLCLFMGLYTNRALALAPGLGLNAVVAFQLVGAQKLTYQEAMGVIVAQGIVILILVVTGLRKLVMDAIPVELKRAISVGIGFFILFIGLVDAGIVVKGEGTPLTMGKLVGWPLATAVLGLLITVTLLARNVRGALLWGIIGATVIAVIANAANGGNLFLVGGQDTGVAKLPSKWIAAPDFTTVGHISFGFFSKLGFLTAVLVILSLFLSDFFDMVGTLIGVGGMAGYLDEKGEFPDVQKPLLVDAVAAIAGGVAGASSATTYIESAAGVGIGGRTGLTAVTTGVLFLLAMPLWPIVGMVPAQATAPALILVGFLMSGVLAPRMVVGKDGEERAAGGIDFNNLVMGLPALVTILLIPLTYSITNGIGAGFILYTFLRLVKGEWRTIHPALYVVAVVFLLYFVREPLLHVHV
jgi:AGZA family xanthine/uracil permease-like MFS transporter